ncbi:MFS transporter [Viridibacillus sp. NPDC093762]|uniref:MFS transporter n=1 Tax=Viridibacillus sp. NPDC093762 TaxID=3390720 RepID=UPI003D0513B8
MISKRKRNWILALLFLGWSLGNLDRYIMNFAVLYITQDLHLSASATGMLLSSFFAGYAIMQLPAGWLADRFGPRRVLLAAVVVWSIFTVLTGAAWSLASMLVIRFFFGIGEGGFQPACGKTITLLYPKDAQARAMSIVLSSSGLMSLIIPIASIAMLTTIGWRMMFVIMGVAGAIVAVLYWYFIRTPERNEEDTEISIAASREQGVFRSLLKTPLVWSLFVASYSLYAVNWGLATWLPTYLVKVRGMDLISLGWIQTIPAIAMLLGMLLSGYILDKLPKGTERIVGSICCVCIGILLYLMYSATSVTIFVTYQTIVVLVLSLLLLLLPAIMMKRLPSSVMGTAGGLVNTGGQLAGFITPMAIGFIVDAFNGSFDAAFWMLIGFAVLGMLAILSMNFSKGALLNQTTKESLTA